MEIEPVIKASDVPSSDDREREIFNTLYQFGRTANTEVIGGAYEAIDVDTYLSPTELTKRWLKRVNGKVSDILSVREDTPRHSYAKQDFVFGCFPEIERGFLKQLNNLPFVQKTFILRGLLANASPETQDRAVASTMHLSIYQYQTLINFFAGEPLLDQILLNRPWRYVAWSIQDPQRGYYIFLLDSEQFRQYNQFKDQFLETTTIRHWFATPIIKDNQLALSITPGHELRIPELLVDRYASSIGYQKIADSVRARVVQSFWDILLFKKLSFSIWDKLKSLGNKNTQSYPVIQWA